MKTLTPAHTMRNESSSSSIRLPLLGLLLGLSSIGAVLLAAAG